MEKIDQMGFENYEVSSFKLWRLNLYKRLIIKLLRMLNRLQMREYAEIKRLLEKEPGTNMS